jgi:hypothetical protein
LADLVPGGGVGELPGGAPGFVDPEHSRARAPGGQVRLAHRENRFAGNRGGGRCGYFCEAGAGAQPGQPLRAPRAGLRAAAAAGSLPREAGRTSRTAEPEPPLYLRQLRDRLVQPLRSRRRPTGRREPRRQLQPPVHLRRFRARENTSAARHRPLRDRELPRKEDPVRFDRDVHERFR